MDTAEAVNDGRLQPKGSTDRQALGAISRTGGLVHDSADLLRTDSGPTSRVASQRPCLARLYGRVSSRPERLRFQNGTSSLDPVLANRYLDHRWLVSNSA